jgi:glycosyltransferase involved in cell wall biosynthesis
MKMRIGIDAREIDSLDKTGIGVYTQNLVRSLSDVDSSNSYTLFYNSLRRKNTVFPVPQQDNFNVEVIKLPQIRRSKLCARLWTDLFLPRAVSRKKINILHIPSPFPFAYSSSSRRTAKVAITIHDLACYAIPEITKADSYTPLDYLRKIWKKAANDADCIITVSESIKIDLIRYLKISPKKIDVVYEGVQEKFRPVTDKAILEAFRRNNNLPKKFILFLGRLALIKNVGRLIEAFNILKINHGIEHKLVICGKGDQFDYLSKTTSRLKMQNDVIFTGYYKDEKLVYLYNLADAFVFPSLYEGFGLPPLEAMACGIPVIASNVSAIPEVVGNAGILIDPYDISALAEAMYKVISDENLRMEMRTKGLNQIKRFDWAKTARDTLAVYRKTLSNN